MKKDSSFLAILPLTEMNLNGEHDMTTQEQLAAAFTIRNGVNDRAGKAANTKRITAAGVREAQDAVDAAEHAFVDAVMDEAHPGDVDYLQAGVMTARANRELARGADLAALIRCTLIAEEMRGAYQDVLAAIAADDKRLASVNK